ncbi:hypothetical protein PSQ40_04910 [Curvibacter sp. HBC61]|uniref:Scaffolding protein n=1 Tax=Curvibacter cyanobacteriorum TaxID=3026422 RepID=A0ABT5MX97_9BURK|nr:hypothetical protein [Curvibacter sp. HBC61]MDD0837906.1 hypothetical protein [Curvibacter sp. HBC61]
MPGFTEDTIDTSSNSINTGDEDRGDVLNPELSNVDALKSVVEGAPADLDDDTAITSDADGGAKTAQEGEDAQGEAKDTGPRTIPKARFNEVNEQRKQAQREAEEAKARAEAAEAELQALRSQRATPAQAPAPQAPAPAAPAAPEFDIKAQERAYLEATMDGDVEKALEIRERINTHIRENAESTARERVARELTERQAAQALQEASEKAVQAFPYLETPEGEEALELIMASRDAKIARGIPAHIALAEAVTKIAPRFAPAESTPSKDSTSTTQAKDTRSAAAIARGLADSAKQPPALTGGVGDRATAGKVDVETMTESQFENLSAAEKKRLRGD